MIGLCATVRDTMEDVARSMFDKYCNEDGLMDLDLLRGVPFVKDLLVSDHHHVDLFVVVAFLRVMRV